MPLNVLQDDNFILKVCPKGGGNSQRRYRRISGTKNTQPAKSRIDKQLANITNAICLGIFNQHTQAKMIELSNTQQSLEAQIAEEEAKTILPLKEARVISFLKNYTEIVKCADKAEKS